VPAPDVLADTDGFEVIWVHTVANATEVVGYSPFGIATIRFHIREAVSELSFEESVSVPISRASP
jgi:hypothetical protein